MYVLFYTLLLSAHLYVTVARASAFDLIINWNPLADNRFIEIRINRYWVFLCTHLTCSLLFGANLYSTVGILDSA